MFFIKQTVKTRLYLIRLIKYLNSSIDNSYKLGSYIAILNYKLSQINISHDNKITKISNLYYDILHDIINENKYHIFNKILSPYVNYEILFKLFNDKLLKQSKKNLFSFFRGYYFCYLNLYSTNLVSTTAQKYSYFVLYDFHPRYLEYIYNNILNLENAKYIHIYNKTEYDKYSINDITDDIDYKLVIKYKSKYYNKIFQNFFSIFFYNIYTTNNLKKEDEIALFHKYLLN